MQEVLLAIVDVTYELLNIFSILVIVHAVLSWIRSDPNHPIIRLIDKIVDPFLRPIQRIIPDLAGIDFSPVILILLTRLVQTVVVELTGLITQNPI